MNITELYDVVEKDEDLEGVSVEAESIVIKCLSNGLETKIATESLEDVEWEKLRSILSGEREPEALNHMSRVVGYFSNVVNWNQSKIGELKDRQKGEYAVSE